MNQLHQSNRPVNRALNLRAQNQTQQLYQYFKPYANKWQT